MTSKVIKRSWHIVWILNLHIYVTFFFNWFFTKFYLNVYTSLLEFRKERRKARWGTKKDNRISIEVSGTIRRSFGRRPERRIQQNCPTTCWVRNKIPVCGLNDFVLFTKLNTFSRVIWVTTKHILWDANGPKNWNIHHIVNTKKIFLNI